MFSLPKEPRGLEHCICGECTNDFNCETCQNVKKNGCGCDCVDVGIDEVERYKDDLDYFKRTGKRRMEVSIILYGKNYGQALSEIESAKVTN